MVKLDDKDLFQLIIAEFRYSVKRDNHLAPYSCAQHIKTYLPEMSERWRAHTAKQLSEEIIDERLWNSCYTEPEFSFQRYFNGFLSDAPKRQLDQDYVWEDLLVFLTAYLEALPHNVDKYMQHIYGHMDYTLGIDYNSIELA